MKTKLLITGGCGFIGTNLIHSLGDEYDITVIDNLSHGEYLPEIHDRTTFYNVDIRNDLAVRDIMHRVQPDVVFHFAGLVSIYDCNKDPINAVSNNLLGSSVIFKHALDAGCNRIIFSETSAVYEDSPLLNGGYVECQSDPRTIYSSTKAGVALLAESFAKTAGLKYTALRYFNVAGPIQDYTRTVPPLFAGIALRLMGGNNPIIFGDGNRRRDFIHVDDINDFHKNCISDPDTINQTFNLGMGYSHSLYQIAKIVYDFLKQDSDYKDVIPGKLSYDMFPEINGEAFEIYANIDHVTNTTGWRPTRTIDDAIIDTVKYLKNEVKKGVIDPTKYMTDLDVNMVKI